MLRLDTAGEGAEHGGRALALGPQQQHLARVRVRRPRLGVQVVAVVPAHHQAEVVHGRERGRPGAHDDPAGAAGHGEEVAVAARRAGVGGEGDVVARTQRAGERTIDPVDVLAVGHAQQRAPPGGERGAGELGQPGRPVLRRRGRPHRPRRAAVGDVAQQGRAGR